MKNFLHINTAFLLLLLPVVAGAQQPAATTPATTAPAAAAQRPRPPRLPDYIENNGLKGNLGVHDPVMIKGGDTYYVMATGTGIKTSKDKITWAAAGNVFDRSFKLDWWSKDIPEGASIWAPDISYRNGKYQMYYSVSAWMNFNSSVGLATNVTLDRNDPRYKWEDQGQVISFRNGGEGVNVIDPNAFQDKDGKLWLLYGSYKAGLRMVELDPGTGKLKNEKPELTTLTTSLGEGVFLVKGPEYYYIFASRGKCCAALESTYQVVIGRSKTITGPYLNKNNESWQNNRYSVLLAGDYDEPGRGHNGIFAEGDTTYMIYHAYTRKFDGNSVMNIRPLYMTDDQWPTLEPTKQLFKMDEFQKKVFTGK